MKTDSGGDGGKWVGDSRPSSCV